MTAVGDCIFTEILNMSSYMNTRFHTFFAGGEFHTESGRLMVSSYVGKSSTLRLQR